MVTLSALYSTGPTNDAYADNLKLTLATVGSDITGTAGYDRITATAASETICGLPGDDVITSGGGSDTLLGGAGNDRLVADDLAAGAAEADTLNGSESRDRLDPGLPSAPDLVSGGAGIDLVTYADKSTDVQLSIGDGPGDGEPGEGDDIGADVERPVSGSGNDAITGASQAGHVELLSRRGGQRHASGHRRQRSPRRRRRRRPHAGRRRARPRRLRLARRRPRALDGRRRQRRRRRRGR